MSFWAFVAVAVIVGAISKVITTAIEHDRETRLAKVESDLKLKLVEKLGDPELVRQVVEARLKVGDDEDSDDIGLEVVASALEKKEEDLASGRNGMVLGGLICTLIGGAFGIYTAVEGMDMLLPALLCGAVGLGLLTFATSQKQIQRAIGEGDAAA